MDETNFNPYLYGYLAIDASENPITLEHGDLVASIIYNFEKEELRKTLEIKEQKIDHVLRRLLGPNRDSFNMRNLQRRRDQLFTINRRA